MENKFHDHFTEFPKELRCFAPGLIFESFIRDIRKEKKDGKKKNES